MVPYTAVPYYGTLSNFDGTGAGSGVWVDVYLCNGQNFTPDLRGRTLVGSTSMLGNAITDPAVQPGINGNPAYTFTGTIPPLVPSVTGANEITLGLTQIPSHTHAATVNDPEHSHGFNLDSDYSTVNDPDNININYLMGDPNNASLQNANSNINNQNYIENSPTGITVTNAATGGGLPHSNIQPSATCYYIMYIP